MRIVLCCGGLFVAGMGVAAEEESSTKPAGRTTYRYMVEEVEVNLTKDGAKKWVGRRSDGRANEYEEVGTTDEYVELRSVQTKNLMRLHADRIRLSKDDGKTWTPWYKGGWVETTKASDASQNKTGANADQEMTPPLSDPDATPLPAGADVAASSSDKPDNLIRLAYFVPKDRQPVRDYAARIAAVMTVVADTYKLDLKAKNYKNAGLTFETREGQPVVHLVRGTETARHYNNAPQFKTQEQWKRVLPEVAKVMGSPNRRVFVVFNETYEDAPEKSTWAGTIALGARYSANGGVGMFSATVLRDEFSATSAKELYRLLFDQTPISGKVVKNDPGAKAVRGEFIENSIGATAHELGHALGLPHDHRQDWNDIMGNGFRMLRANFTPTGPAKRIVGFSDENARLLMSSRYVASDLDWTDNKAPTVTLKFDTRRKPLKLSVIADDDRGLRAITYMDRIKGTVIGGIALKGAHQSLDYTVPATAHHDGRCDIEAFVTDNGGNLTRTRQKLEGSSP
ncbi:MAG: hypothetical protein AABP62_18280 [Planctomycetota bacterium]